ncbi:MAG: RdgB/HAM1 family non-canonical purine NTP pyrophosphatase [Parachlamydia sp.]|jgi:XTP/dITP diphosphohydrolase|nr:RdgB/HAM1 family non-canonical purine NTP pyrophosphatase [Parachlamydia sp.]
MEIVLATTNLHKWREYKDLLKPYPIELLSLHQFPHYSPPEETGGTFKENAILKAESASRQLNAWVLADDSGLSVSLLQGLPGIHSRTFAGKEASDSDNRKKLLADMRQLSDPEARAAYFECALALASPDGLQKCVQGTCEGFIAFEESGRHGFGYDPLFIKNDYDKTFAELDETTKNRISHRRRAFDRLLPFLETFC